ncbi:MAG: shikimate dehydrogenase [Planctomycetaceae bacterium]|nr:shikimate dehydrogenase [Planctomycetaceae bacterium]
MQSDQHPTRLICCLTSPTARQMRQDMETAAARGADTVECRLDYLDRLPDDAQLERLLKEPPAAVIVTCRPTREGGRYDGDEYARLRVLCRAANLGATVDIERDVPVAEALAVANAARQSQIIRSHHDFNAVPDNLDQLVAEMEQSAGTVTKIVFTPSRAEDGFRPLDLLRSRSRDMIALAMGEAGIVSRILGRKFGAYGTFTTLNDTASTAPGQVNIDLMRNLYRWQSINERTAVYGVVGCPIAHSLSPAIHNAAFEAAAVNAVYVPMLVQSGADNFNRFMDALLERPWLDWRGLSVTIPHKEAALAYVGPANCEPLAAMIGAVNTITIGPGGTLSGRNTDYAAAIDALCNAMSLRREELLDRPVAVLGAGGAARAVVAALVHYGAQVTVYNRTLSRAKALAEEFFCTAKDWSRVASLEAQVVINCTSIGMHPGVDDSPLAQVPPGVEVIFDTIYNPIETKLLKTARAAGCRTVSGVDMFVNQAVAQFETWTGIQAPREIMRSVVLKKLQS